MDTDMRLKRFIHWPNFISRRRETSESRILLHQGKGNVFKTFMLFIWIHNMWFYFRDFTLLAIFFSSKK